MRIMLALKTLLRENLFVRGKERSIRRVGRVVKGCLGGDLVEEGNFWIGVSRVLINVEGDS